MATPAEVAEALAGLREGSAFSRARSAAEVFRAFASLTTDQKRDLAVLVAERAAPHLVPRIESETGLELSREQVQAVIDMAGRLDDEDLDELAHTVRDREARGEALRTVATSAAAASGLDDVVTPEPADEPEPADVTDPASPDEPEAPPPPPEPAPVAEPAVEVDVDAEVIELDHAPEPTVEVEPAPEPREFVSIFDTLDTPSWDTPEPLAASDPHPVPAASPPPVDLTTRVRASRQPLVERLRSAANDAERLRVLRPRLGELADLGPVGRAAVVDAIPDGWARRRAVDTMVVEGVLTADELPDVVRRIGSPMARAWVCATAIEAGLLAIADIDDLVDPRAGDRLRRRYA